MKDQHTRMLHGRLLRPLKVGSSALIDHEGQFILTSLVTSIQVQNEQEAKFETLNTHYHVKFFSASSSSCGVNSDGRRCMNEHPAAVSRLTAAVPH